MKKKFLIWIIAVGSLSRAGIAGAENLKSECVPNDPESAAWPVKAIYLHGWYHEKGNKWYANLERTNRAKLLKIARDGGYRIAIPVAQSTIKTKAGAMRTWDNGRISMANVEQEAKSACGGAALAKPRALIGFSAGGYATRNLACRQKAAKNSDYGKIMVIGAPSKKVANCTGPTMYYKNDHNNFMSPDMARELEFLKEPSPSAPGTPPLRRGVQ